MRKNVIINSILLLFLVCIAEPSYGEVYTKQQKIYTKQQRIVVYVSEKKHTPSFVWKGLDTYGNPTVITQSEQYILKFVDINGIPLSGFLQVSKEFYNETWIGRPFTRTGDIYQYCIPNVDGCSSFKD